MKLSLKNIVLLVLMLVAAGLGSVLRPTISLADERPPINLKQMVPTTFGDWHEQLNFSAQIIDPQQKQMLDKLYSETLSRTYVNSQGYRIMLSIAYGKNQSDAVTLHKPEICYPAQGFELQTKQHITVKLDDSEIKATSLTTKLGQRFEPVTYWMVIGDQIVSSSFEKKIYEIRYGLIDRIPDGMLVRISSIDTDTNIAFAMQRKFATELVRSIASDHRPRFVGVEKIIGTYK